MDLFYHTWLIFNKNEEEKDQPFFFSSNGGGSSLNNFLPNVTQPCTIGFSSRCKKNHVGEKAEEKIEFWKIHSGEEFTTNDSG